MANRMRMAGSPVTLDGVVAIAGTLVLELMNRHRSAARPSSMTGQR